MHLMGKKMIIFFFAIKSSSRVFEDEQWNGIQKFSGWWFQTFFVFHNIWDNPSHRLIFFKMVKSTNQLWFIECRGG